MADTTAAPTRIVKQRKRRPESIRAEAAFRARLEELGATLLDPWMGDRKPHRVTCAGGHLCTPRPSNVRHGQGVCKSCARRDPKAAWEAFRARVEELGGVILEPGWKGTGTKHEIRCKEGHISYPYPNRVMQGVGLCGTCAGVDPRVAEAALMARLEEVGVTLLEPYQNAKQRLALRCAEGHEFSSVATHVVRGGGVCRVCAGRDPVSLLAAFRGRVEAQGGTLLETAWLGTHEPHEVLCAQGHACSPRPSGLLSGKNICRICACRDPRVVEERFRERVIELGGTVLGPWSTVHVPVLLRCPQGHETSPVPNNIIRGAGLCRFCAGKAWDAFYVVRDGVNDVIKFGVTSGNPRIRLGVHERDGFDQVVRMHTRLPGDAAPELERTILAALRDAREQPVRGREYFRARVLPTVLDIVDNHPAIRQTEAL